MRFNSECDIENYDIYLSFTDHFPNEENTLFLIPHSKSHLYKVGKMNHKCNNVYFTF
jgi:hypothetical protein